MHKDALVSIICPVYNAERFVDETIRSVLNQTYSNWELLLIVDAKSSDQALFICKNWQLRDPRIQVLEGPTNLGVANNRNNGIQAAKGEFIAFLDSDDVWLPEKLERQTSFMLKNRVEFSCHTYGQMAPDSSPLPLIRHCPPEITYVDLLKSNVIGCLTVMVRTSVIKQFSFNPLLPHEDFVLWLEILRKIPKAYGLDEKMALYRVLPQSRSGNKKQAALDRWNLYRQVLKLSFLETLYYFVSYAFKAVIQRVFPSL